MKITMFGATGRTGSRAAACLLQEGYEITALVRTPEKLPASLAEHPQFHAVRGEVRNENDLAKVFDENTSLVYSALSTDKSDTLSAAVPLIINQMKHYNIRRIITIGTAGILRARSNPDIFRFQSGESKRKMTRAAEEHASVYYSLNDSGLDWTIFCPTYLPEGDASDNILWEIDFLPSGGSRISTGSTALFTCLHLWDKQFFGKRVGLTESD